MSGIYISISKINSSSVQCDVDSAVVFFIYKYLKFNSKTCPDLYLVINQQYNGKIKVDISDFLFDLVHECELNKTIKNCLLPAFYSKKENYCIAGFCGVLRQLVKICETEHWLLGFRQSCLSACAEFSIWTKFCEVDLVTSIKRCLTVKNSEIPVDVIRLEQHLRQPVRMHNIRKISKTSTSIDGVIQHCFVEGPKMYLSDLIILPLIHVFLYLYGLENVSTFLPLICKWYKSMLSDERVSDSLTIISISLSLDVITEFNIPKVRMESLYKCDPRRYKTSEKLFTKQNEIDHVISLVDTMEVLQEFNYHKVKEEIFDWDKIPYHAHPKGGDLPDDRLLRKMQQIENIVNPILKIAECGDTIVDFCCGAGHVGILIAYLLPKCQVILLDNKEHSLKKASNRIIHLNLSNVSLLQSNIDYFKGNFQLGVTLHACGIAADLVMKACISNRSKFVISPCCYGKLQINHILKYPRSKRYSSSPLTIRDYIVAGHSADQTHKNEYSKSEQGEKCMKIVDIDRCLHADECNYKVFLAKMKPSTCSPKNNFIIGIPREKYKRWYFN